MVITPQQAGVLSREEIKQVATLEKEIDQELRKYYATGAHAAIGIHAANTRVAQKLIDRYEKVGWNVEYRVDQRAGQYLEFSEQRPIGFGGARWQ